MPYLRLKDCIAVYTFEEKSCYYCSILANPQLKNKGLQMMFNCTVEMPDGSLINNDYYCIYANQVVKTADTIKDLCDKFIEDFKDGDPLITSFDELVYYHKLEARSKRKHRDCYGAIWTDKGLIYVAKLNDKSKLELLNI